MAGTSSPIRNFLGFLAGISGGELAVRAFQHAWMFGAEFVFINGAAGLAVRGDGPVVALVNGGQVSARAVVLATGVSYRRLEAPGIAELVGAGVFYGSALSEAPAVKDQEVFHRRCRELRRAGGRLPGQVGAQRQPAGTRGQPRQEHVGLPDGEIDGTPGVRVRLQTGVAAARGDGRLTELVLRGRGTGQEERVRPRRCSP